MPLVPGDSFLFFTDGISEAMNGSSELFGEGRLASVLKEANQLSSDELKERILHEVRTFAAGESPHDDMTLVIVKAVCFMWRALVFGTATAAPPAGTAGLNWGGDFETASGVR